jgi:hypothetical protein
MGEAGLSSPRTSVGWSPRTGGDRSATVGSCCDDRVRNNSRSEFEEIKGRVLGNINGAGTH